MSTNKAQIWSFDFIIAAVIFSVVLFVFLQYSLNINLFGTDTNKLLSDVNFLSNHLVSQGVPNNWTCNDDINLIGLTDGSQRIVPSKVQCFYNLSDTNYLATKRLLSISSEYQVVFLDRYDNPLSISEIYFIGKDISLETPENVITSTRFLIYNSSIIKMVAKVW